jgi:hypothetical protein
MKETEWENKDLVIVMLISMVRGKEKVSDAVVYSLPFGDASGYAEVRDGSWRQLNMA